MKVLLDTCVWGGARPELESAGHDVVWTGDWDEDPGDEEILHRAHQQGRNLVTLDKDFGELAIVYRKPHSGILRLVNIRAREQAVMCRRVLSLYGAGTDLTIYNAASSTKTLKIMALITAIDMPFVVAYTAIIYWTFRGPVKVDEEGY